MLLKDVVLLTKVFYLTVPLCIVAFIQYVFKDIFKCDFYSVSMCLLFEYTIKVQCVKDCTKYIGCPNVTYKADFY